MACNQDLLLYLVVRDAKQREFDNASTTIFEWEKDVSDKVVAFREALPGMCTVFSHGVTRHAGKTCPIHTTPFLAWDPWWQPWLAWEPLDVA